MGLDNRIGSKFLHAGPGFGGSCFPKDLAALTRMGEKFGVPMQIAQAASQVNARQRNRMVEKIRGAVGSLRGKVLAMLGVSFKPNTNDIREAPALSIAQALIDGGATVRAFDPVALEEACRILPQLIACRDAYDAAEGAEALVIATEWNQFRNLDFGRLKTLMRTPILVDLRNIYDPQGIGRLGFQHISVGRPKKGSQPA
jgi:UDPglucose 6-dehydrogenase